MSGGFFDYQQYRLADMATDLDLLIRYNGGSGDSRWSRDLPPDVLAQLKHAANLLREAEVYVQRIDWLLSGDDGEEQFRSRLSDDLACLTPYPEEPT